MNPLVRKISAKNLKMLNDALKRGGGISTDARANAKQHQKQRNQWLYHINKK